MKTLTLRLPFKGVDKLLETVLKANHSKPYATASTVYLKQSTLDALAAKSLTASEIEQIQKHSGFAAGSTWLIDQDNVHNLADNEVVIVYTLKD